jgi:hypothetical protein
MAENFLALILFLKKRQLNELEGSSVLRKFKENPGICDR